jgi:hypothetical protein
MPTTNPIRYTSRTFLTILADINADPTLVDKPDWWKRCIAGIGDVLSVINNSSANNGFLRTAFTKQAVADLLALIDYFPTPRSMASGTLLFDLSPSTSYPHTIAQADLAAVSPGTIAVPSKRFEARSPLTANSLTEATLAAAWTVATDQITVASVFTTGEKVRLTFSATPPTTVPQVAINTDYFAIYVDATHIRLATSRAAAFAGTYVDITAQGTGTHTLTRLSRAASSWQQTSVANLTVGTSDGATAWQEFTVGYVGVDWTTLVVVINGVTWTRVDTPVSSLPADKVYRCIPNTDGTMRIRFGDGTYGAVPGAFDVVVSFAYGGGSDSNVATLNSITQYVGADTAVTGVTNSTAFTGGADDEAMETSKVLGPLLLKARDRFVTVDDGIALVRAYGGVAQVAINKNVYGVMSCQVVGVANGGGNPSPALRAAIQAMLITKSVLDAVDVRFTAATLTAVAVTSAAKVASGYTWAGIQPYFQLAWQLFLSEAGYEIKQKYTSEGVAAATALINTVFTATFGSADYAQISRLLDALVPRAFGDYVTVSDAYAYVQAFVLGIEYMTIASTTPALPYTSAVDEILTPGVLTLSQIP